MPDELLCPIHGPYPASQQVCLHCSGESRRPPVPLPLADDAPTDLHGGAVHGYREDDLPTDMGYQPRPARAADWEQDDFTDISASRRARGRRFVDIDEEEETQLARARLEDVTELEYVPTGLLGILWVKQGKRRGQIYSIKNGTVVGRKEGNLILDDPKVSNMHAKFTLEEEQFVIWDFGSSNGTYVNGERIRAATSLTENDEIKLGDMVFVLKTLPEP